MRKYHLLMASILGLLLTGCQAIKPKITEPGMLNQEQIQSLFINKTVESKNLNNNKISYTFYATDGEVIQQREGKIRLGKWKINSNNKICLNMENTRFGCRYIVRKGDQYFKYKKNKKGKLEPIILYGTFSSGKTF